MGTLYSGGSVKRELGQRDGNSAVKSLGHLSLTPNHCSVLPSHPPVRLREPDLMVNVGSISFGVCKERERARCCSHSYTLFPAPSACFPASARPHSPVCSDGESRLCFSASRGLDILISVNREGMNMEGRERQPEGSGALPLPAPPPLSLSQPHTYP